MALLPSNTVGHCVDAKSFADRGQGSAAGAGKCTDIYLCAQSQQQGKATPLCLGHAFSPKTFDEGMNMWVFCAEKHLAFHFHMKLDDDSFQCQLWKLLLWDEQ